MYHLHDDTSNCNGFADSCVKYKDYIKLAQENNMTAIAFSNHGGIYDWVLKKQACDRADIKYIHGVELYLCHKLEDNTRGWHIGLYAKNWSGVKELNALMSLSTSKGRAPDHTDRHLYFNPRISFEELFATSSNIIITTACLASPLWRLSQGSKTGILSEAEAEEQEKRLLLRDELLAWLAHNKDRCFLEIQHHNNEDQIAYNKMLYEWSKIYGIPLIAGTDTHSTTAYKTECRKVLQKSKKTSGAYEDEGLDLTWKTYDQLTDCFRQQGALPMEVCLAAIENTNVLADMVEPFTLDRSFKYPTLYGENANAQFVALIRKMFCQKMNEGIIDTKRLDEYQKRIREEFDAFAAQGMESFMMFMSELLMWCKEEGIHTTPCRGSVGGSLIAYIIGITDVDPLIWHTVFARFCNADRISLADIDVDFSPADRPKVYEYIIKRFGNRNSAYILTTGTVQDRGSIDLLARGLEYNNTERVKAIKNRYDSAYSVYAQVVNECIGDLKELSEIEKLSALSPNFDDYAVYVKRIQNVEKINILTDCKEKWDVLREENKDLFYYFDGIKGCIVSKGMHAAGIIGSPITLDDNLGVFYKDGNPDMPVSFCSMKAVDSLNYVKFDILGLKTVGIIQDALKLAEAEWPYAHKVDWDDSRVWTDIVRCNAGIFQFEGDFAHTLLRTMIESMAKKNIAPTINHMSMVSAALRPSGKSYRDKLVRGEVHKNPSGEIDELLKENNGYLIFQEDTIKFLTNICDFGGAEADTTRRAIGKKDTELLKEQLPRIAAGYCHHAKSSRTIAENEVKEFVQIISDSSDYQFGYNHATGYSMTGYQAAYVRTYYLLEFITAYFNWSEDDTDYAYGMKMIEEYGVKLATPKFRYAKGRFFFNRETRTIYKGVGSLKHMSVKVGDELFALGEKKYKTFVELLYDVEGTSCNIRQLDILIKIGYFEEFGSIKKLLTSVEIFELLKHKKEISKEKIAALNTYGVSISAYANDISQKTKVQLKKWVFHSAKDFINEVCANIPDTEYDIRQILGWQKEILNYLDYTDPSIDKRYAYVLSVDGSSTIKARLCCLQNGKIAEFRVSQALFGGKPFEEGDFVYTSCCKKKYRSFPLKKDERGRVTAWGKNYNATDWWLEDYYVVDNIKPDKY